MLAAAIYALCAATSLTCAVLLLRSYSRAGLRLLLWSGLCFVGLTANNVMLVLDRIVFPAVDLTTTRLAIAFVAYLLLLIGLVWEND
jgi:hypothetical protein